MKYNAPFGNSNMDAAYVNGNPETGTMGSIPPAASIEHPQREIVKVITAAGYGATETDLTQLAKAIQSSQLLYADDMGTVNSVQVSMDPVVGSNFVKGMTIISKIAQTNTGPSTIHIDGAGPWSIVPGSAPTKQLTAMDLNQGQMVALCFDGANFQLVWSSRQAGSPVYLPAPRDYYVNIATGSDTYDGTLPTFTSANHGPFKTLQHAVNQVPLYNMNGHWIRFLVADGVYEGISIPKANGAGYLYFLGNTTTPGQCEIHGINKSAILAYNVGCNCYFDGFKLSAAGVSGFDSVSGIVTAGDDTLAMLGVTEFGTCVGAHISPQRGGRASNLAPGCEWKISGGCSGNQFVPGCFIFCYVQGDYTNHVSGGPKVTFVAPVTYAGGFVIAVNNSWLEFPVKDGLFYGIPPNTVTGYRYMAGNNSTVNSGGGGPNYYPGTLAGYVTTGGYYS